ncbi:hypothetical protein [Parapedobacter tibetensis]|uniref:hypothetical protein n=1 Tax=Parapedobacter tibetensis TaxID=2972951 RepID=UPI00214DC01D|nr:hypothetical protein [Parapedobacter tibetensis]
MRNTRLLILCIAFSLAGQAFCQPAPSSQQQPPKGSLTSGSIDSQFIYLNAVSNNYQEYKVVRRTHLDRIRKNVADTLSDLRGQLIEVTKATGDQQAKTELLSDSLSTVYKSLQSAKDHRDNFSFLGMAMHKSTYSILLWSLVLALAIALTFYIYRFNQSHMVTKDTKKAIEDLQMEFDQHRKKAMEKEQKLKRQLQDEINKRFG